MKISCQTCCFLQCGKEFNWQEKIEQILGAGYDGIDIGYEVLNETTPIEEIKAMDKFIRSIGGEVASLHSGSIFLDDEEKSKKVMEYPVYVSQFLKFKHVVNSPFTGFSNLYYPRNKKTYEILGQYLDKYRKLFNPVGLKLGLENHAVDDRYVLREADNLKYCLDYLDETIGMCPDPSHFVLSGDEPTESTIKWIKKGANFIHIKDYKDGKWTAPGDGPTDFKKIIDALKLADYDGWLSVELEHITNPNLISSELKRSLEYMRAICA